MTSKLIKISALLSEKPSDQKNFQLQTDFSARPTHLLQHRPWRPAQNVYAQERIQMQTLVPRRPEDHMSEHSVESLEYNSLPSLKPSVGNGDNLPRS
ncbi:hypothetical protein NPIL_369201 [Nephila pilipes]|uniref:Uncharacterized protein n=1 Tax=Nephila pilipes TaxID=299642 RepID=A0A8X6QSI4_NEPPI|nr:hypothetical protein NPIL_369201 [Nephila pilipes]